MFLIRYNSDKKFIVVKFVFREKKFVLSVNSDFLFPISLQPNVVDIKGLDTPSGCNDIGFREFDFVAKT